MRHLRIILAIVLLANTMLVYAMDGSRSAYPPPSPAVSSGSIVQIIFSLLLVLAAIVLVAWLLKRMNLVQQGTASHLRVIGGIAIGQRERVVLVEIDDTWLVVGVGPGQIRTLHTLPKPPGGVDTADITQTSLAPSADQKFAALLSSVISRRPTGGKSDAP